MQVKLNIILSTCAQQQPHQAGPVEVEQSLFAVEVRLGGSPGNVLWVPLHGCALCRRRAVGPGATCILSFCWCCSADEACGGRCAGVAICAAARAVWVCLPGIRSRIAASERPADVP